MKHVRLHSPLVEFSIYFKFFLTISKKKKICLRLERDRSFYLIDVVEIFSIYIFIY